jgi:hypothetical protein
MEIVFNKFPNPKEEHMGSALARASGGSGGREEAFCPDKTHGTDSFGFRGIVLTPFLFLARSPRAWCALNSHF